MNYQESEFDPPFTMSPKGQYWLAVDGSHFYAIDPEDEDGHRRMRVFKREGNRMVLSSEGMYRLMDGVDGKTFLEKM